MSEFDAISEKELAEIVGGTGANAADRKIYGPNGLIGAYVRGVIVYNPCPNCGKPLYFVGRQLCCAGCGGEFSDVVPVIWNGTKEELITAAS